MKRAVVMILSLVLCLALIACAKQPPEEVEPDMTEPQQTEMAVVHESTAEEAKSRMDSGDPIVVLDVRTQEEYDQKHIDGAVLLPNEQIADTRPDALPELDAEILVYCRSGNRSRQAADNLVAMGYTAVYDFGGINSWPYDTVSGS